MILAGPGSRTITLQSGSGTRAGHIKDRTDSEQENISKRMNERRVRKLKEAKDTVVTRVRRPLLA